MIKKLKVHTLQKVIKKYKLGGHTVGFVPTMGALHDGHISLIEKSIKKCDKTVCSIFVNPTQFNDKSDLKKYPRTIAADSKLLKEANCDLLFLPTVEQIYPSGTKKKVKLDLNGLDLQMEGAHRPGHFDGVVQVVHRLLDIVKPDKLFMGQKDFQQFTIIQHMIDVLSMPVELVVCPTKREANGLARSSRNERLLPEHRKKASIIYKTLKHIKKNIDQATASQLSKEAMKNMSIPDFNPEYVNIVDGRTLKPVRSTKNKDYLVACTAVWAGEVRLIDNIIIRK